MLDRLFRRKSAEGEQDPAEMPPGNPALWDRIKAFFIATWNWTILLAAIVGALICVRMTIGFWSSAESLEGGNEPFLFRLMAGAFAATAAFLIWQVGRGVRYLWHRRRRK